MKRASLNNWLCFFIALLVFILSSLLSPYYLYEDQETYRLVYKGVQEKPFIEAFSFYKANINTDEFGHFLVIWLFSSFAEKDLLMSFLNGVVAYLASWLLKNKGANFFVIFIAVVLGYYSWSLFLSAERLKVSTLFLLLGFFLYLNRSKFSFLLAFFLSVVTHLQNTLVVIIFILGRYYSDISKLFMKQKVSKKAAFMFLFVFVLVVLALSFFYGHISYKLRAYSVSLSVDEFLRLIFFFVLTLFYGRKELGKVVIIFSILFIMVSLVGGMRINVLGYFVFLYYCVQTRRGLNFGFFITSAYYFLNLIDYVFNVVQCGSNNPC